MINVKFLFFTLTLLSLLMVTGCSGTSETKGEVDNNRGMEQVNSDDDSEDSPINTIPKPPGLTIYAGEEMIRPVLGTYSWGVDNKDGTTSGIEADSFAPPELVKNNNSIQVTADTNVELVFEEQPESYTMRIWDDDNNIVSESSEFVLPSEGKVIYEVLAHWEQGKASYAFSLNIE